MRWQTQVKESIRTARQLAAYLPLDETQIEKMQGIVDLYPMAVTPYYLSLVDPADENDPIRRMCVPSIEEFSTQGRNDTSGEAENTKLEGLQHKYPQTALVLSTNICAMYCRHCFRKRMVGLREDEVNRQMTAAMEYIGAHPEIDNVLISGGDAFLLPNTTIRAYLSGLSQLEHIQMVRFGTRTPVVLPMRISEDQELQEILREYSRKMQIYVVTQFNHPRELTQEAQAAIDALLACGVVVSNQTVLLRGVNDRPEVLAQLMQRLTQFGVVPYYVFQCRPVTGVCGQFQVPIRSGYAIVEAAKAKLNGHAKRFRYVMSHVTGKIEILGFVRDGTALLAKYHQAKNPEDQSRIFTYPCDEALCWLPDELS